MRTKLGIAALAVPALVGSFAWGLAVQRSHVFPYDLAGRIAIAAGVLPQRRTEILPRNGRSSLDSLPYLQSSHDVRSAENGVILHDRARAKGGYNFWNSWTDGTFQLMDMDGTSLHEWTYHDPHGAVHHAELLPNGDVVFTVKDFALIKINARSKVLWKRDLRAHHDVWVGVDGSVLAVVREDRLIPAVNPQFPTIAEKLVFFSPAGDTVSEVSLTDLILREGFGYLIPKVPPDRTDPGSIDVFHVNHVEVFDGSREAFSPLFASGNVLISIRNLNSIAILNAELTKILWIWGPSNISVQHHPTLLPNGNILVFDNGRESSRILEVTVPAGEIVWQYSNGSDFFSGWGGANQRLTNGNTLITQSGSGRAFEVTPNGEKVWEFANPNVSSSGNRTNIWRLTRIDPAELTF